MNFRIILLIYKNYDDNLFFGYINWRRENLPFYTIEASHQGIWRISPFIWAFFYVLQQDFVDHVGPARTLLGYPGILQFL